MLYVYDHPFGIGQKENARINRGRLCANICTAKVLGSARIVSSHIEIHTAAAYQSGSDVSIVLD